MIGSSALTQAPDCLSRLKARKLGVSNIETTPGDVAFMRSLPVGHGSLVALIPHDCVIHPLFCGVSRVPGSEIRMDFRTLCWGLRSMRGTVGSRESINKDLVCQRYWTWDPIREGAGLSINGHIAEVN
jgi:hypothetical protein